MVAPAKRVPTGATDGGGARVALAAVVLLGGLVYLNALPNPFVYDDYRLILENTSLQRLSDLRTIVLHDMTRPVANFSYAMDYALWGTRPFGFHLTNLLLHLFNIVLLFAVARTATKDEASRWPETEKDRGQRAEGRGDLTLPILAAALFAVHPMLTESVGYVSSRSEVLCATLFLAALLSGRLWLLGGRAGWGLLTLALWVLALGVRETAAMLPFVLLAHGFLLLPERGIARRLPASAPPGGRWHFPWYYTRGRPPWAHRPPGGRGRAPP